MEKLLRGFSAIRTRVEYSVRENTMIFWRWISNHIQRQGYPYRLILSKFGREREGKIRQNSNFTSSTKWLIIIGDGDRSIIFSSHEIQRLITEKLLRGFSVIRTRVEYSVRENTMIFWRWISNHIQRQGYPYRLILSKFGREWEGKIRQNSNFTSPTKWFRIIRDAHPSIVFSSYEIQRISNHI